MTPPPIKPKPGATINPLHPLARGLVGCWLMNGGSGSRAYDISGKNNHGTLNGMSTNSQVSGWSCSKFGGGLGFDGNNDYVIVDSSSSLGTLSSCTIGLWVYVTGGGTRRTLATKWSSFFFEIVSNHLNVYLYGTTNQGWHISNTAVPLNEWVFIAFTYDGNNVRFYQNGIEDTNTPATTGTITTNTNSLYVGDINPVGPSRPLGGHIDKVYMYNIALSRADMKQLNDDPLAYIQTPSVLRLYSPAAPTGWTGTINGVTNSAKIYGIPVANIAKVSGVS